MAAGVILAALLRSDSQGLRLTPLSACLGRIVHTADCILVFGESGVRYRCDASAARCWLTFGVSVTSCPGLWKAEGGPQGSGNTACASLPPKAGEALSCGRLHVWVGKRHSMCTVWLCER